jgi:hypothetical protein
MLHHQRPAPEFKPWMLVGAAWASKRQSGVNTGSRNGA